MSIIDDSALDVAFDPTLLDNRDRIAIWRIARDEVFPLRWAEVQRDEAARTSGYLRAAHLHTAAVYEAAFALAARQSAVEFLPVQGPVAWPDCGHCGVDPAAYRVFADAVDGGELLACDACADGGNPMDSPAIAWVERVAIGRVGKTRVDEFDEADIAWAVAA